jgi:hypothetical protein
MKNAGEPWLSFSVTSGSAKQIALTRRSTSRAVASRPTVPAYPSEDRR